MHSPGYIRRRSIHSGRLERWLGAERIETLSRHMREGGGKRQPWYGPPINITDCPGSVWIGGDGDFAGDFDRGFFGSAADSFASHLRNLWKAAGRPFYVREHRQSPVFGAGFASISDALARASSGYSQLINGNIAKSGPTGVVGAASSLWRVGAQPSAGGAGSAAPAGMVDGKPRWDWPLYYRLAPVIRAAARAEHVPLEWGGYWKSFPDAPHWQLPRKKPYI